MSNSTNNISQLKESQLLCTHATSDRAGA
jgi:hypothetical protein